MQLISRIDRTGKATDNDAVAWKKAGQRVAQYRKDHSIRNRFGNAMPESQAHFAARVGVSLGTLVGFERGTRVTRMDQIKRIAAGMELTVEQLMSGEDVPPAKVTTTVDPRVADLTDEDIDIARLFHAAYSEPSAAVKAFLLAHLRQRRDAAAVAVLESLRTISPSAPVTPTVDQELQPSSPDAAGGAFRDATTATAPRK
jgi:transcriptional regulator with XRE-family HTH domain